MARERVKLEVYIDVDPDTPGNFHTPEDVRHAVGMSLTHRFSRYNPSVRLASPEE